MTRSSPGWLLLGFAVALLGVGFPYWQLPYGQVSLPNSLFEPGLAAALAGALLGSLFLQRSSRRP